jgi:hypothetical protein
METCVLQGLEQLVLLPRYTFITPGFLEVYIFVFMPIRLSSVSEAPANQPLLCFFVLCGLRLCCYFAKVLKGKAFFQVGVLGCAVGYYGQGNRCSQFFIRECGSSAPRLCWCC